jgi:hypothetical protein
MSYVVSSADDRKSYEQYVRRVVKRARAVIGTTTDIVDVFRKMRGAFPTDLRCIVGEDLKSNYAESNAGRSMEDLTEGHLLDAEWYFTDRTATVLSRAILDYRPLRVLLLGCPRLVTPLMKASVSVDLFDYSDHGIAQFIDPDLLGNLRSHRIDITSNVDYLQKVVAERYDAVALDPPWYLAEYSAWLSVATSALRSGGVLITTLIPPLTRPTASIERRALMNTLNRLGKSRLRTASVEYLTPRFEYETMAAAGMAMTESWRRGDCVITVRNSGPEVDVTDALRNLALALPVARHRYRWDEVRLENQYVKIRDVVGGADESRVFLQPAIGQDYQVRTISSRSIDEDLANVWTSRNRAGFTNAPAVISEILRDLASSRESEVGSRLTEDTWAALFELLYGVARAR